MNKVVKIRIIKPVNEQWKTLGDVLYTLNNDNRNLLNKCMQRAWEYYGFSADYKEKNGEYPKTDEILGYKMLSGYLYDMYKNENKGNTTNYSCAIGIACDSWKNNVKDILKGEKSIPSFKENFPIEIHNKALKLYADDQNYYVNLSLLNQAYAKELGRTGKNKCSFDVVLGVDGGKNSKSIKSIVDRCINGEYKVCQSKIERVVKNKKSTWWLLLNYSFETKQLDKVDNNKIMGIDMGIKYPVYYSINENKDSNSYSGYVKGHIKGGEIEQFRKQTERRRIELLQQGKYCGEGRIGHGRKTRIKPIENISDKIARFRATTNHKYSRFIVDEAVKNGCGVIQMEDLSGIATNSKFLKSWSYYDLQQKITYKAKEVGIEVRKISPKYTSQRCSKCGHIHEDNRLTQEGFECLLCGEKMNADENASRNISIENIEKLISDVKFKKVEEVF